MLKNYRLPGLVFIFCLAISFFINKLNAQGNSASFQDSLVNDFCNEFSKSGGTLPKENFASEVGMMMLPLFTKYRDQIKKEWGFDVGDAADAEKAGEKIGQLTVIGCPAFREFVKNNLETILDHRSSSPSMKYEGKILRVEGSPFAYLVVKNTIGKEEKMYWMEYFEGADQLGKRSFLNKNVVIKYRELEVYQTLTKDYKIIKVITGVSLK